MATFLTGATGYLGSYIAAGILREHKKERLALLVRASDTEAAKRRLWKSMQLHMEFDKFIKFIDTRVDIYTGDLTSRDLGLDAEQRDKLVKSMDSVIHCAASLNRKSAKACFNVNLRGTLEVIKLARAAQDDHGLRRFSDISTVAVSGQRQNEVVTEENTVEWDRSDYDPYARTKKFCEHMLHELLPEVSTIVFRPSTVLGDSRFAETTQFDMVRAFAFLAQLPVLPFEASWRMDIIPANYVSQAIVTIHMKKSPKYDAYNLGSGRASLNYEQLCRALESAGGARHRFVPMLGKPFETVVEALVNTPRGWGIAAPASLMKVFLPYLMMNTVFDNSRVVEELGYAPAPFNEYAWPLLRFAVDGGFKYPYQPWPGEPEPARKVA